MDLDDDGYGEIEIVTNKAINKVYFRNNSDVLLLIDKQTLGYEQVTAKNLTLSGEGKFSGKFSCNLSGKQIASFGHVVKDGNLYITLYGKGVNSLGMETDSDGFVTVDIDAGTKINKVYYRYYKNDTELEITKK